MNLKELKEIIDIVTSKEAIEELEIEKSGVRLRIKRTSNHAVAHTPAPAVSVTAATSATQRQVAYERDIVIPGDRLQALAAA